MKTITNEIAQTMTIKQLKSWDIKNPEEERIIQEILLAKAVVSQPIVKFNHRLVPDIKKPEDEKIWQDKIDKFNEDNSPIEAKIAEAEKVLEVVKEEVKEVIAE